MTYILLFCFVFLIPTITQIANDPAPGVLVSKSESRNLACHRTTTEGAYHRYPGQIVRPGPRGDYVDRSAVICTERLMAPGDRSPRDEAILSTLDATAAGIATTIDALHPQLKTRRWLVETFYPSPAVATKISFAQKSALVQRGYRVSDRTPSLAPGDIDVLARMDPADAYPLACRRFYAEGGLRKDDVLLGIVLRDRRETILHAGLCARGTWRWMQ